MTPAADLAARIERLLQGLQPAAELSAPQQPAVGDFLADWPRAPERREPHPSALPQPALGADLTDWPRETERREPHPSALPQPALGADLTDWPRETERREQALPVLLWLSILSADAASFAPALVAALCRASPRLQWRQTYSAHEADGAFLDNYGWTEIIGTCGPLASERMACGFLVLGPCTLYPRHRHLAEELYLPLSGTAAWQQGDGVWREHRPGTLVHHAADEPHSMRTGETPLLALYLWRGAGLTQQSQLDLTPD